MNKALEADIPDSIRPYLNEISERLWAGRAAVMVGAGFSKNAGDGFPDWTELGDILYQKAHGVKPSSSERKYLNVLRLAEEVQAAIGRPALENLLRSNISDLNNEPSNLHVELLELPWVDIFTTNYDTLLERASAKVVTRRYEPVVNKEDIPYALKPRIVKLHGSFPSERPFIITEEDYRRYPCDYAPFVNTVQQALLENTFCLIGFSGDDPNFLQWIGWIRDNLGQDKTQKIYLIGIFELSSARLQLLAQRGIIVVDLSVLNGIKKNKHKKAFNQLFEYIRSKKPDALDWPYNPQTKHPTYGENCIETIQKITSEWARQRHSYPGWLILPYSNREKLWGYTDAWTTYLPDVEESPPGLDIQYTFELIWRLEKCLQPIFDKLDKFCEQLLEKYWPFDDRSPPINCQIHPREDKFLHLKWHDIRHAWLTIQLAMLRFYREEGALGKWREAESQLKSFSDYLSAEQKEFMNYEGFLFSLFTLDLLSAKQHLQNWRPNEAQPYWMAKRAAGFAEIGQLSDTAEQIRMSLVETRKKSKSDTISSDYLSVSNESFQMLLFRYVRDASDWIMNEPATPEEEQAIKDALYNEWKRDTQTSQSELPISSTIKPLEKLTNFEDSWSDLYTNRHEGRKADWNRNLRSIRNQQRKFEQEQDNARWDELKAFRCDPWNELKLYELTLNKPPITRTDVTHTREFDIGQVTQTRHLDNADQEGLNGYSFLRFFEEVGLPFRIGDYTMMVESASASLQSISRYSPFWAIATLVRVGDTKAVSNLFCRKFVYRLTTTEADELIQNYLDVLKSYSKRVSTRDAFGTGSYGGRLIELLPEVISRLCCKCSIKMKQQILEFLAIAYRSIEKINYRNVRNLIKRLIISMSELEQYKIIPDLLKIPFPENMYRVPDKASLNPFLILELDKKPLCASTIKIEISEVDHLLQQAGLDDIAKRKWAIMSLVTLYNLQLLNSDQTRNLAQAIWNKTDQYGLPENTDFYKFAFLKLPYPGDVKPAQLFKTYVKKESFPIQKNKQQNSVRITGGNIPLVSEILGANSKDASFWTTEDATKILNRLLKWWDSDKDRLNEKESEPTLFSTIPEEFRARFSHMSGIISEVIAPKLGAKSSDKIKNSLNRLLKEMRGYKLPTLEAEVASLHIFPDQQSDIYSRINETLLSGNDKARRDALKAILRPILNGIDASSVESEPVSMLSQYLIWSPTHSITQALWIIVRILESSPANFTGKLEVATQKRLNNLLAETAYDNENPDFDEILEVRRVASVLAAALWKFYKSQNLPIPDIIKEWQKTCLSPDEFAEIRNAWCQITI